MKKIIYRILLYTYPVILFLALSILNNGAPDWSLTLFGKGIYIVKGMFYYNDLWIGIAIFAACLLLLYLVSSFIYSLTNRLAASYTVVAVIGYVFYIANYYRTLITGKVLTPDDLTFVGDMGFILSVADVRINTGVVVSFVLVFGALAACYYMEYHLKKHYEFKEFKPRFFKEFKSNFDLKRWLCSGIPVIVLGLCFTPTGARQIGRMYPDQYGITPAEVYSKYSPLLGFWVTAESEQWSVDTDFGKRYDRQWMEAVYEQIYSLTDQMEQGEKSEEKPNVIVIMSEAFWDPTKLENIEFSHDPIPNMHALAGEYTSGQIVSPVFGGTTCNPEFEVLTMNSMSFLKSSEIPYQQPEQYIAQNDTKTLPRQFKNNGYSTVAVHSYEKSFFNRDVIYPQIGFDQFIASEDMPDAWYEGYYIADDYFYDKVIEQIEQATDPLFLFGITMENHYEYFPGKFVWNEFTSHSPMLSEEQCDYVNSYLQGVNNADRGLAKLLYYLQYSDKSTIVFFFGDHLPIIDKPAFDIYCALDFFSSDDSFEWTTQDYKHMYSTPYLLWRNDKVEKQELGDFSPVYIGPLLLQEAGLSKNVYAQYLLSGFDQHKVMHKSFPLDQEEEFIKNLYYMQFDYGRNFTGGGENYIMEQLSRMMD